MKRSIAVIALLLILTVALGACGEKAPSGAATDTSTDAGPAESTVALEGFDAMPTDGEHESAALAVVPGAFAKEKAAGDWADVNWAALEGVQPILVAYLVQVDLGGQVGLFEVRADGVAHNIYGYQRAFDSGSIIWTPDDEGIAAVAPKSAGETSAAAAVEAAMRDAFPDDPFTVAIHGYRFAYLAAGMKPFTFEIAPDSTVLTIGR